MAESELSLLNVFEVDQDGERVHLLCFAEAVLGGAQGLAHECVVGEIAPDEDGALLPEGLMVNPLFVGALEGYLNHMSTVRPELATQGAAAKGDPRLVLLDPRFAGGPEDEPPIEDVLGSYALEPDGAILPDSFVYNHAHRLFDPNRGPSGLFHDLKFYEWLHPEARQR